MATEINMYDFWLSQYESFKRQYDGLKNVGIFERVFLKPAITKQMNDAKEMAIKWYGTSGTLTEDQATSEILDEMIADGYSCDSDKVNDYFYDKFIELEPNKYYRRYF